MEEDSRAVEEKLDLHGPYGSPLPGTVSKDQPWAALVGQGSCVSKEMCDAVVLVYLFILPAFLEVFLLARHCR